MRFAVRLWGTVIAIAAGLSAQGLAQSPSSRHLVLEMDRAPPASLSSGAQRAREILLSDPHAVFVAVDPVMDLGPHNYHVKVTASAPVCVLDIHVRNGATHPSYVNGIHDLGAYPAPEVPRYLVSRGNRTYAFCTEGMATAAIEFRDSPPAALTLLSPTAHPYVAVLQPGDHPQISRRRWVIHPPSVPASPPTLLEFACDTSQDPQNCHSEGEARVYLEMPINPQRSGALFRLYGIGGVPSPNGPDSLGYSGAPYDVRPWLYSPDHALSLIPNYPANGSPNSAVAILQIHETWSTGAQRLPIDRGWLLALRPVSAMSPPGGAVSATHGKGIRCWRDVGGQPMPAAQPTCRLGIDPDGYPTYRIDASFGRILRIVNRRNNCAIVTLTPHSGSPPHGIAPPVYVRSGTPPTELCRIGPGPSGGSCPWGYAHPSCELLLDYDTAVSLAVLTPPPSSQPLPLDPINGARCPADNGASTSGNGGRRLDVAHLRHDCEISVTP